MYSLNGTKVAGECRWSPLIGSIVALYKVHKVAVAGHHFLVRLPPPQEPVQRPGQHRLILHQQVTEGERGDVDQPAGPTDRRVLVIGRVIHRWPPGCHRRPGHRGSRRLVTAAPAVTRLYRSYRL